MARTNLDGFVPRKRVKTTQQKKWSQNVSNFWDLFWQPPGLRIGANYFPRSKYSSLKVSDYLRKPCFLTFFLKCFLMFLNTKKQQQLKSQKIRPICSISNNFIVIFEFSAKFRSGRLGQKSTGQVFEKYIKIFKLFSIILVVFQYFWYQNRGFRARDKSLDLRLEIPLRMVKFSFQNSLMAPSYDPNTGPKKRPKNNFDTYFHIFDIKIKDSELGTDLPTCASKFRFGW